MKPKPPGTPSSLPAKLPNSLLNALKALHAHLMSSWRRRRMQKWNLWTLDSRLFCFNNICFTLQPETVTEPNPSSKIRSVYRTCLSEGLTDVTDISANSAPWSDPDACPSGWSGLLWTVKCLLDAVTVRVSISSTELTISRPVVIITGCEGFFQHESTKRSRTAHRLDCVAVHHANVC